MDAIMDLGVGVDPWNLAPQKRGKCISLEFRQSRLGLLRITYVKAVTSEEQNIVLIIWNGLCICYRFPLSSYECDSWIQKQL